jgi:hypothetical protein
VTPLSARLISMDTKQLIQWVICQCAVPINLSEVDQTFCAPLYEVIHCDVATCCSEWKPPSEKTISVVACNVSQVLCAAGSALYYLEICENQLVQKGWETSVHIYLLISWAGQFGVEFQWGWDFPHPCRTSLGAHATSCAMGIGSLSQG